MQAKSTIRFSDYNINVKSSSPQENKDGSEICIANISPAERRRRLNFGIIQFVISLIILAALLLAGADKLWRLTLFLPFAAAFTGYFQARDKT